MMWHWSPPARGRVERGARRPGFSFLELQVAFVLFAIALAGVCPLVVVQSRQLSKIEDRLSYQTTYYVVPSSDPWTRKLGAAAAVMTVDPGPPPAPPVMTIDNGDPGYSESGTGWRGQAQKKAFQGSLRWHARGTGSNTASWTFTGLSPCRYRVEATWVPAGNRASNAPYTLSDGSTGLGTLQANQKLPPVGDLFGGSSWSILGTFAVTTGTLQVQLSDKADGRVVADGVRIIPVQNTVQVLSLDRSLTSENVTAHVSVTVQGP
ncbi:MAG TPA: hypothetical protein VG013_14925 [Gemmataceae bacterium]|jgi:hypothetical protein|nr:hypothetical protein [Gemmataceae bacterium]